VRLREGAPPTLSLVSVLRFIGNVLWLLLVGWASALSFAIAGVIMYIFIITIPFGVAAFRIANFSLWPFGRRVIDRVDAGAPSLIGNVLWFVFAGVWIAIGSFAAAIGLMLTIIGIPFAIKMMQIGVLSLFPLGKQIVSVDIQPVYRQA